jgi:hypothetical protein
VREDAGSAAKLTRTSYIAVSHRAGRAALLPLSPVHEGIVSAYKTQQHRLVCRGRTYHFVSYEGTPADVKRQQPELPAAWFLMLAGKRWMVAPQVGETAPAELDRQFGEWLESHVFGGGPAVRSQVPPSIGAASLAGPAEALRTAIPPPGARP